MSTTNNVTSTPNSTIKRRKRLLSSATRLTQKETNETPMPLSNTHQKKRKRKLNAPTVDKPIIVERTSSTSPPPATAPTSTMSSQQLVTPMSAPAKRSIRAAQEAIAKREKQRQAQEAKPPFSPSKPALPHPEKVPVIKKKRKLNTQKVLIPKSSSSQEFEANGDDIYDKYLESNTAAIGNMATARISPRNHATSANIIPTKDETKPAIVIGVPTRKRKLVAAVRPIAKPTEPADAAATESKQDGDIKISKLDLSQHSILPNQSYVAHLPQSQINRRRSTTASTTTSAASSVSGSITSHTDLATPEIMFTMETYTTKSSPTIFYDAISDFEDMNIDDHAVDQDAIMSSQIEQEELSSQQQSPSSFWESILKPFQH
ncbi:hypothetical protein [Parasitella parasitica]|uniref:Uncharacterized protein n=1 Tax=Parasitella parasitica TaxID=35722 RepID=A0A0B7NE09_9FUNG|nr:hypothetical protein [Parasitella parasitica]